MRGPVRLLRDTKDQHLEFTQKEKAVRSTAIQRREGDSGRPHPLGLCAHAQDSSMGYSIYRWKSRREPTRSDITHPKGDKRATQEGRTTFSRKAAEKTNNHSPNILPQNRES